MNAFETIKEIIRNKVALINMYMKSEGCDSHTFDRFRNELVGMMICLKNINTETSFYCINYYEDHVEFGYYTDSHKWVSIEQ